ncbi:uncharacterized protein [Palaemon carinicauda]|uniref:uncharacterized protein n=1 Tax=Palaemon carinicauda TaxID=392227 RepID=UPI0035B5B145
MKGTKKMEQPSDRTGCTSRYLTIDYIHVINQLMEKLTEYDKPLCMAFMDYKKDFDSVKTSAVMKALPRHGIDESFVRTLGNIDTRSRTILKLRKDSEKIQIKKSQCALKFVRIYIT